MKQLADCRVLVVDDARANVDILVAALKDDYKLSVALNGEAALRSVEKNPPDLVLLDIMMPGMDGYEVCRRLRASPDAQELPIMFLSALDEVKDKTTGFEVGGTDYVTKPFDILEVKARVKSLLKAKAYSDTLKEQIESELRIAREIQMGMVPTEFSAIEKSFGVGIAGIMEPARQVGGDLYAVFPIDAKRLCLVMGDVSGKGIPAALFMVRTASLLRTLAKQNPEPRQILRALNDELASDNPSGMFVTLVCAIFDPTTNRMVFANGGQTQPILICPGKAPVYAVEALGTALGLEEGIDFGNVDLELGAGDMLVFSTDGVIEAFNGNEECFEMSRLISCLSSADADTPGELNERVLSAVRGFAGDTPQSDDIALLTFRVERSGSGPAEALRLDLQATPQEVMRGCEALGEFCRQSAVSEKAIQALTLAFEEAGSNVVQHAYAGDGTRRFSLSVQCNQAQVVLVIRDAGPPFNPLSAKPAEIDLHPDDREIGGLGVHLIRQMIDEVTYTRVGEENELRLVKQL